MADITMCNIGYCKMIPFCQRHQINVEANPYSQSYLVNPIEDCKDNGYPYYMKPVKE